MMSGNWDKVASQVNFNLEIDHTRFSDIVDHQSKVLDFGCGYGRVVNDLTKGGYIVVTGIDPSNAMINRGRWAFPQLHLLHSDGTGVPFDDNLFDVVVVCAVFTCIPSLKERSRAVAEIIRVLKPGGIIHLSEFCSEESENFVSGLGLPMRYSSPRELRELFANFLRLHDEVIPTSTMSGERADNYRAFIRNNAMHAANA